MTERVTVTWRFHTHVDKACVKYDGTKLPSWFRWLYQCSECRRAGEGI